MTKDDIIRMARDVLQDNDGVDYYAYSGNPHWWGEEKDILKFSLSLIAAEREKMVEEGWRQCAVGQRTTQFCGATEAAIKEEREACARLLEDFERFGDTRDCVIAIRARNTTL